MNDLARIVLAPGYLGAVGIILMALIGIVSTLAVATSKPPPNLRPTRPVPPIHIASHVSHFYRTRSERFLLVRDELGLPAALHFQRCTEPGQWYLVESYAEGSSRWSEAKCFDKFTPDGRPIS